MKHFETTLKSNDNLDLFCQGWLPETPPRAVICLVHGLGEHSGRYAHVAEAFNLAGYAVIGFDLRGHGKSGGQRGHAPSFEAFMQDIDRLFEETDHRFPHLPRFLYGHSLGGVLVLNYALRRKPPVRGVVATSSGLRTALEDQKVKVTLAKVLGTLFPTGSLPSGLDPATLSRDPSVVAAYQIDPLVHDAISFGMGKYLLEAIRWAFEHAVEFPVPLLLVHGMQDMLAFPSGSQDFAARVPGDCTLKLWEGLYHETHNEPEKAQVLEFTRQWLDARVA